MKRIVSIILSLSMLASLSVTAHATAYNEKSYWGYAGETVLIDKYEDENFTIASYYDGEIVYTITLLDDGRIEFAWAPINGTTKSLWFTTQDICLPATAQLNPEAFGEAVKEYGLANSNRSTEVNIQYIETSTPLDAEALSANSDVYNSLISQLRAIYGPRYYNRDWTGMYSLVEDGLTYRFKEDLTYDMYYRDGFAFSVGTSVGSIVTGIISLIPGVSVAIGVISVVLGVAGTVYTVLDHAGVLSNYRGEVIYSRYVLIDNVEYFTCSKKINYNGWVDESNSSSATIEELDTEYGPAVGGSPEMFESYIMQKDRARYIYRMENNE